MCTRASQPADVRSVLIGWTAALATIALGCASGEFGTQQREGVLGDLCQQKRAFAESLFERNRIRDFVPADRLPAEADWERVSVLTLPWGVVVQWQRLDPELGLQPGAGSPLCFSASGAYLCAPDEWFVSDVTGDGVADLVTAERVGFFQSGFFVYPGGKDAPPSRWLGSIVLGHMPPTLADFDGDGTAEIVVVTDEPALTEGEHNRTDASWVLPPYAAVWSLKYGIPRLLLAVTRVQYGERMAVDVDFPSNRKRLRVLALPKPHAQAASQPKEEQWLDFTWDSTGATFVIPDLRDMDVRVLINATMLK